MPHPQPAEPGRVGHTFTQKIKEGGRVTEYEGRITAWEAPAHLGLSLGDRHFTTHVDYRFTAEEGATRLDYSCRVELHNLLARIMGRLFGWLTRRIVRKQMAKLKAVAEEAG